MPLSPLLAKRVRALMDWLAQTLEPYLAPPLPAARMPR